MNFKKFSKLILIFALLALLVTPKTTSYAESENEMEESEEEEGNRQEETIYIYDSYGNYAGKIISGVLYPEPSQVLINRCDDNISPWYHYKDLITSIIIETTSYDSDFVLTRIGQRAFKGLENVNRIIIPKGITTINSYAFDGCTSLEKVAVGESIKKIGDGVFSNCPSLKYIAFPNTYFEIGSNNFDSASELNFISYKGGIAESYCKNSELDITFCDMESSVIFSNIYYSTKDNIINLDNVYDNIYWEYNPCDKSISIITLYGKPNSIVDYNYGWSEIAPYTTSILVDAYITSINEGAFKDFTKLKYLTLGEYVDYVEGKAFYDINTLSDLIIYSELGDNILDADFLNGLSNDCEVICHYSDDVLSLYQILFRQGKNVSSFEGTERLATIGEYVTCANQFDGIRYISKKVRYIDENGNVCYYTKSWASSACIVTSVAMLIEREAYLKSYEPTVGNFDQDTVSAIVKEISYDYILVNGNWLYIWGEHTSSYDTLMKDGEKFTVTTNSLDNGKYSEEKLMEMLDQHQEGVVVFNNRHAVCVIGYVIDENNKPLFTVWDPADGEEHVYPYSKLNGKNGFKLMHIIYIE